MWDSGECSIEHSLRNNALIEYFPHRFALKTLHPANSRFRAASAFDVALKKLEGVNSVDIETGVANAHRHLDVGAERHKDFRRTSADRHRRTGHERNAHLQSPIVHPFCVRPFRSEILIIEDRNDTTVFLKRIGDLLEETSTRIQMLFQAVPGVISVFANADHTIHRNMIPADCQRSLDGVKQWYIVLLRHGARHVSVSELIGVHRRQFQGRTGTAVLLPAFKDLADQHVSVQSFFVGRKDRSDRL